MIDLNVKNKRMKPPEETMKELFSALRVKQKFLTKKGKALLLKEKTLKLKRIV